MSAADWSEGYVNDINYTYGYYPELNPQRIAIPFLQAGLAAPKIIRACELGFGQGVSVNIHAAAGGAEWAATDFNPSQVYFARRLADQSGVSGEKLLLAEQGFVEFCARSNLPDFDFIALHGVWSWISDENRHIIVDFVRRKLTAGGVLYISYNTLPAWSAHMPVRHLLQEHGSRVGHGNRTERIRQAVQFGRDLLKHSPWLVQRAPDLPNRMQALDDYSADYIAHEYLNKDWQPMYFSQMEEWLGGAKLSYACSARHLEDIPACLFDEEQQAFFNSISDPSFAQTAKDYLLNRQFRCDYWAKGSYRVTSAEQERAWDALDIILLTERAKFSPDIAYTRSASGVPELFNPVLDYLADSKVYNVGKMRRDLVGKLGNEQLYSVLAILFGKGDIAVCSAPEAAERQHANCRRFNRRVLESVEINSTLGYLASPVLGGGIGISYLEKLFLHAHAGGLPEEAWDAKVWQILQQQGQILLRDGNKLESEAENLDEIARQKIEFLRHRFDLLQKLECLP